MDISRRKIPRAMSTQHPDNAFMPAFVSDLEVIKGEDEIAEADYVFSVLGCDEQMWDYEGKAADEDVVLKLLLRNPEFYRRHILGKDIFLTLRIPNPTVERSLRKKVEEALHSITNSFDLAQEFYGDPMPPIFEVILPFTTSAPQPRSCCGSINTTGSLWRVNRDICWQAGRVLRSGWVDPCPSR